MPSRSPTPLVERFLAARTARFRLLSLLVFGPVLALFLVDLAIANSAALWGWVASEY